MKPQFSLATLLAATAFAAMSLGGIVFTWHFWGIGGAWIALRNDAYFLPWWLPIVFIAYSIGRKQLTVKMVICFGLIEAMLLALSTFALFRGII